MLLLFFRINTSLCHLSFPGKLIYRIMDIHVLRLASLCRSEFAGLTALILKFTKSGKIYFLLDSPNVNPQFKKIKDRRQIPTVNDLFCYGIEQ